MITDTTASFVTMTVVTADAPASTSGTWPAMTHLAAIAMLTAERDPAETWTFTLEHSAIGAGESENVLLGWAADTMPERGVVIGWQLADAVVTPLLAGAQESDPDIASAFLARLLKLVTSPSVDLSITHGDASAPPLADVAAARGIVTTEPVREQIESAWAFGNTGWLCDEADRQVVTA